MTYESREIKDRVAIGDDCYIIEDVGHGRVRLIPAPDSVIEVGTSLNRELLQPIEDRVVWLMNRVFDDLTGNPFLMTFADLNGLTVTGIWNSSLGRVEC